MGHHKEIHPHEADYKVGRKIETEQTAEIAREAAPSRADQPKAREPREAQETPLRRRLGDLRVASTDAWSELKSGMGSALNELKDSVQKAANRFESALRPEEKQ